MNHHEAFLATQAAKTASRMNRRKKLQRSANSRKAMGHLDLLICSGITILFFCGNKVLGLVAFVSMWLPCFFDVTRHTITRPPWTTVKGDPDCPICHGQYFLSQGILTYWLGWKECSCQPKRVFKESTP